MAERKVSIRLSVEDAALVRRALEDIGSSGQAALTRLSNAGLPASRGLLAVNAASREVQGTLGAMASRLGPVGAGLAALGPAGLVAGGAIAGLVLGLKAAIFAGAEAESSYRRLEAVLAATGNATGFSAQQINDYAEEIERTTLASAEAVQDAATIIATAGTVTGESFLRTLRLAQDMAAVFGGDVKDKAQLLAKTLAEPENAADRLRRAGVVLTAAQRQVIEALAQTGDEAGAVSAVLDALEKKVGGAGAAEQTGVTGAVNQLTDAWDNMLKSLGRTPAVGGAASFVIDTLRKSFEGWTKLFSDRDPADQLFGLISKLRDAEAELRGLEASNFGKMFPRLSGVMRIKEEIAGLQSQIDAIMAQADSARSVADQTQADLNQSANTSVRDRRVDQADELLKTLDPTAKKTEELTRQQALLKRVIEESGDPTGKYAEALGRVQFQIVSLEDPVQKLIRGLKDQTASAGASEMAKERLVAVQRAEQAAMQRGIALSADEKKAVEASIGAIQSKTAALNSQKEAVERAIKADEEYIAGQADLQNFNDKNTQFGAAQRKSIEDTKKLTDAARVSTEEYEVQAGVLEEIARRKSAVGDVTKDEIRQIEENVRAQVQASRSLDKIKDSTKAFEDVGKDAFRTVGDEIVRAFVRGEGASLKWGDIAKGVIADFTISYLNAVAKMAAANAAASSTSSSSGGGGIGMFGGILSALGSLFGGGGAGLFATSGATAAGAGTAASGFAGTFFHGGGMVGRDGSRRSVAAEIFHGAPRLHRGGLAPDEVPAIFQTGERVLSREETRRYGQKTAPVVNQVNHFSAGMSAEDRLNARRFARDTRRDAIAEYDDLQRRGALA